MFTGIVEEVGYFQGLANGTIRVQASKVLEDVHVGDSIDVNGICLTVVRFSDTSFEADVMPETMRRTSFHQLTKGSRLNLERALPADGRLGGHIVSGHIDGVGRVKHFQKEGNALLLTVVATARILRGVVEKGSVALDGISLTVVSVSDDDFTVSLIPHTREVTNLCEKKAGDLLNIETDVIGKYVEKFLSAPSKKNSGGLTRQYLLENGF